jgi:beta-lactamase superfamily II metal-dependent hydrolase
MISPTGKTEIIDFGTETGWSPISHIFKNYIGDNGVLDRLVLTHHHGDHMRDWDSLKSRAVDLVLRRKFEGRYEEVCKNSNFPEGNRIAKAFDAHFASYNETPSNLKVSPDTWGVTIHHRSLSIQKADELSSSDNSAANNASFVRIYDHNGTKILLAGDMETEGMDALLIGNPTFKSLLKGVNILIAPHHGHKSGFSSSLIDAIGKPDIVIASMKTGNKHVDGRYSSEEFVSGVPFGDGKVRRLLTTRQDGAITVTSSGGGGFHVQTQTR